MSENIGSSSCMTDNNRPKAVRCRHLPIGLKAVMHWHPKEMRATIIGYVRRGGCHVRVAVGPPAGSHSTVVMVETTAHRLVEPSQSTLLHARCRACSCRRPSCATQPLHLSVGPVAST